MRGTTGRGALLATLLGTVAALVPLGTGRAGAAVLPVDAGAESAFVARINSLRTGKGLSPLAVHPELTSVARRWATRMAQAGQISHNPALAREVTANWTKLGENVGMGPDVGSIHAAFVASPSHYRNLVNPHYTYVGVGVVAAGEALFTAHQFMATASSAPRVAAGRTKAPASPPSAAPPPGSVTSAPPPAPTPWVPPGLPRVLRDLALLRHLEPV